MDADGDSPPFWSQATTTTFFYSHRRPRQSSPIFNPVILILAIPILILVILLFLVPPFISHTTQILHLNSVKKGWDSLIIVLVLFAILCGLFARINYDVPSSDAADQQNLNVPQVSDFARPPPGESVSSSQWYGFFDGKEYGGNESSTPLPVGDGGGTRLRSSSSSYLDLRQESLRENRDNRFRFSNDFELKSYRTSPVVDRFHHGARWSEVDRDEPDPPVKVIPVDKYEQPVAKSQFPEVKSEIIHRKKSLTTKEIATAIASLYNKRRERKKKVKTRNIYDTASASENSSPEQSGAAAARPSPPPPSKLLQNMSKKSVKNTRVHSPPSAPAPPPPPEPRRYHSVNAGEPPKPNKRSSYSNESVNIALIPIPPLPPSFKMNEMKFVEREDFVRVSSAQSSQCSSPPPELEDSDLMSVKSEGGDSMGPSISCPSPDVDAKAEAFIARLRDEWKLDKMNSINEKRKLG
ncbi:uncharacterized protein LOC111404683 [Olea europaea var. sylvestris]|uniref:uncharacterized protein LOC111404683 n=1 Tax=Olea europaea var. sylvestris TaxID=158386 RepID=UPI000C1D1981|nr:uncharacterized protein LOC111404683 [Olea europaea var. sylvestris]